MRRAVAGWYNDMPAERLAYQAVKYRQRDGWSHRDALRLAHPDPATPQHDALYQVYLLIRFYPWPKVVSFDCGSE